MTNEKDANVIHNLFYEFHYADNLGVIKSKLAEYVATVRAEERKTAFREIGDLLVNGGGNSLARIAELVIKETQRNGTSK